MEEKLIKYFYIGDYESIDKLLENIEITKQKDILEKIALKTESLSIYTYINYRILKNQDKDIVYLHQIAIEILITLCFIEGAYSSAFYHAKQILKLQPENVKNLEQLLFFYEIPETLLNEKEAIIISKKILESDKKNVVARRILNKLTN